MNRIRLRSRESTVILILLQLAPTLWLCRDFVFRGELLLSVEVLDMSYGWAKHLDEAGWDLESALWDRNSFCGIPFLANPATRTLYPPDLFLRLLTPVSPEASFSWLIFFHLWMLGIGGALWLRGKVASRAAYTLGGWLMVASGYVTARTGFADPAFLFALAWIPWILRLLSRLHRPFAKPVLTALFVLEILAGRPDTTFYLACLMVGLFLWTWGPRLRSGRGRVKCLKEAGSLCCVVLVAFLLTAPQLLPTMELQAHSTNRSGQASFDFSATDSLFPWQYFLTLVPGCLDNPNESKERGDLINEWTFNSTGSGYHEVYAYMGQGTLLLAFLGLLTGRRREKWFWAAVVFLALLLAMGKFFPLFRFFYDWVPGWNRFRVPPRVLVVLVPGLACLAALGTDRLADMRRAPKTGLVVPSLLLLVPLIALLLVGFLAETFIENKVASDDHLTQSGAAEERWEPVREELTVRFRSAVLAAGVAMAFSGACILGAWRCRATAVRWGWATGVVVLLDVLAFNGNYIQGMTRREFSREFPNDPLIEAYSKQEGPKGRILVTGFTQQYLKREIHPWFFPGRLFAYDLEMPSGYGPFLLAEYVDAFEEINPGEKSFNEGLLLYLFQFDTVDWDVYRYFNISQVISPSLPSEKFHLVESKRYRGRKWGLSSLSLFECPERYPRTFLYSRDDESAFPKPDPSLGEASLTVAEPTRVKIDVTAKAPARLAHLETWFPGWTCTVNGRECSIGKVGKTFRSVDVPEGHSEAILEYHPAGWTRGVLLFFLGFLCWCVLFSPIRSYSPRVRHRASALLLWCCNSPPPLGEGLGEGESLGSPPPNLPLQGGGIARATDAEPIPQSASGWSLLTLWAKNRIEPRP